MLPNKTKTTTYQCLGVDCLCCVLQPGFVNSLQFSPQGDFLLAGVGQEHRLGRWWRIKQAKNAVYVIPLPRNKSTT